MLHAGIPCYWTRTRDPSCFPRARAQGGRTVGVSTALTTLDLSRECCSTGNCSAQINAVTKGNVCNRPRPPRLCRYLRNPEKENLGEKKESRGGKPQEVIESCKHIAALSPIPALLHLVPQALYSALRDESRIGIRCNKIRKRRKQGPDPDETSSGCDGFS